MSAPHPHLQVARLRNGAAYPVGQIPQQRQRRSKKSWMPSSGRAWSTPGARCANWRKKRSAAGCLPGIGGQNSLGRPRRIHHGTQAMTARWLLLLLPLLQPVQPLRNTPSRSAGPMEISSARWLMAGDTTEIAVYDEAGRLSRVSGGRTANNTAKGSLLSGRQAVVCAPIPPRGPSGGSYFTWHPNGKPFITGQYDSMATPPACGVSSMTKGS